MEIRRLRVEEVEVLVDTLWIPFAEEMGALDDYDALDSDAPVYEEALAHREQLLDDPESATFVAEADDTLVGYATLSYNVAPPVFARDAVAHFEEIYVATDSRREGVATRLMEAGEDWAEERDADYTTLSVNAANENAQAFYDARGYDVFRHRLRKDI